MPKRIPGLTVNIALRGHALQVPGAVSKNEERDLPARANRRDPPADGNPIANASRKVRDIRERGHRAEILALAFVCVNALGCPASRVPAPEFEGTSWDTYLSELARAPSAQATLPDSIDQLWEFHVGRGPAGSIAVGDSVVVAATSDKKIAVLRRGSGDLVWRKRLKGPAASGPLFTGEWVFAASGDRDGKVHGYELRTGKRRWMTTTGPVVGPIALLDSILYAATAAGFLMALDAFDGDVLWTGDFGRPLRAGVTIVGPHLVIASDDSLFLVSRSTGEDVAATATDGAVLRPPAITRNLLATTSPDGIVTVYGLPLLDRRWQRSLNDPVFGSPSIARDTVFVTTLGGSLWRIPLRDPRGAVEQDLGVPLRASPAPLRTGVLVATVGGAILWVRSMGDEPLTVAQVNGPIEEPPLVSAGTVYFIDGRGTVHAWEQPEEESEEP
jgi:outer membrane protein assembly factor BamB